MDEAEGAANRLLTQTGVRVNRGTVRSSYLAFLVGARGFEPLASSASRNAEHIGLPAETGNAGSGLLHHSAPLPHV